ncbi:hypothetical protein NBRGN_004_00870 [Nocardia brasiliensis NBRC 14402]|nr:hypothetical protein NBRGN_004_00870 [Nocardia brasiliensis NBRC 14402]
MSPNGHWLRVACCDRRLRLRASLVWWDDRMACDRSNGTGVEGAMMGAGEVVLDSGGILLAYFERDERDGTPWADELVCAPGVSGYAAAPTVARALEGWGATAEGSFGRALVEAGAKCLRTFHTYTLPLVSRQPDAVAARPARYTR